jgi:hypothetical protein
LDEFMTYNGWQECAVGGFFPGRTSPHYKGVASTRSEGLHLTDR